MSHTKQTELEYKKKINDVLVYIQNNLDSTLTLDILSAVANTSKFHFHRIFNAATGESVLQYIKRIRLENAAFRLHHTTDTITDIAFDSGYNTVSAFSKSFIKQFDTSPREYRKMNIKLTKDKVHEENIETPTNCKPLHHEIKDVAEHTVIFVRKTGEYTQAAKSAWEDLIKFVQKNRITRGKNIHIGITYDSPEITAAEHIRYDACISYDPKVIKIEKKGNIGIQRIEGGKFAIFTHSGDYQQLWKTYHYIYSNWLFSTNHKLANYPSYSVYKQEQSSWEQEIDIYIPIR
jgi:AraC family transcriptional regulator